MTICINCIKKNIDSKDSRIIINHIPLGSILMLSAVDLMIPETKE